MKKFAVLVAALALFAAACGGGGDSDELSTSEWCALSDEVSEAIAVDDNASVADIIDEYGDRVPDEIKDDIAVIGDFLSDPETAVVSEVEEASNNITAYEDENCGTSSDSGDSPDSDEGDDVDSSDDGADDSDDSDVEFDEDDTLRDIFVDSLMTGGLTEEQANCVADGVDFEELVAGGELDPFEFLGVYEDCGVDLESLE